MSKLKFFVLLVLVLASFLMVGCDSGKNYNLKANMDAAAENMQEVNDVTCGTALNADCSK